MPYTSNQNINGLEAKATPIGADQIVIGDTADSNRAKKTTFTQLLTFLTTNLTSFFNKSSDTLDDITTGSTNVHFTATDNTKLDGIEALADVTDENNVVAALSGATLTEVDPASTDKILILDASDSNNLKNITWSDVEAIATGISNVVEDTTPQLGGNLDSNGNSITGGVDIVFQTGATGGKLKTGTTSGDKYAFTAYDVDGTAHTAVQLITAGNTVENRIYADYVNVADFTDPTKQVTFDPSGATTSTATDLVFSQTANRTITFPDATGTIALTSDLSSYAPLASPTFTGTVTLPTGLTGVIRADSGVVSVDTDVTDIVSAASDTAAGKVELATDAETVTGSATDRATTPANITARLAAPGTIGGTTPGAATFTTATTTGNIELGHASDTTLSRVSAGVMAVEGVTVPTISSTNTLTNKRITKRTSTETSSATPTINTDNVDEHIITAQAADITSFTTNLSGTPTTGQGLFISVTGTAARAITWGASFANGPVALPTTTVTTTALSVFFRYDGTVWRCMATGSTV